MLVYMNPWNNNQYIKPCKYVPCMDSYLCVSIKGYEYASDPVKMASQK